MIIATTFITMSPMVLIGGMLISAVILACWLGSKKNRIIDVIAGILVFFILLVVLFSYHPF